MIMLYFNLEAEVQMSNLQNFLSVTYFETQTLLHFPLQLEE